MKTLESFSSVLQRRNGSLRGPVQPWIYVHHSYKSDYNAADMLSVKFLHRTDENKRQQVR